MVFVIKSSELGLNCWSPSRFITGHRCGMINRCSYPEKTTCEAVEAEILYEINHLTAITTKLDALKRKRLVEISGRIENLKKARGD